MFDDIEEPREDAWEFIKTVHRTVREECDRQLNDLEYRAETEVIPPSLTEEVEVKNFLQLGLMNFYLAILVERFPSYRERILALDWYL